MSFDLSQFWLLWQFTLFLFIYFIYYFINIFSPRRLTGQNDSLSLVKLSFDFFLFPFSFFQACKVSLRRLRVANPYIATQGVAWVLQLVPFLGPDQSASSLDDDSSDNAACESLCECVFCLQIPQRY